MKSAETKQGVETGRKLDYGERREKGPGEGLGYPGLPAVRRRPSGRGLRLLCRADFGKDPAGVFAVVVRKGAELVEHPALLLLGGPHIALGYLFGDL